MPVSTRLMAARIVHGMSKACPGLLVDRQQLVGRLAARRCATPAACREAWCASPGTRGGRRRGAARSACRSAGSAASTAVVPLGVGAELAGRRPAGRARPPPGRPPVVAGSRMAASAVAIWSASAAAVVAGRRRPEGAARRRAAVVVVVGAAVVVGRGGRGAWWSGRASMARSSAGRPAAPRVGAAPPGGGASRSGDRPAHGEPGVGEGRGGGIATLAAVPVVELVVDASRRRAGRRCPLAGGPERGQRDRRRCRAGCAWSPTWPTWRGRRPVGACGRSSPISAAAPRRVAGVGRAAAGRAAPRPRSRPGSPSAPPTRTTSSCGSTRVGRSDRGRTPSTRLVLAVLEDELAGRRPGAGRRLRERRPGRGGLPARGRRGDRGGRRSRGARRSTRRNAARQRRRAARRRLQPTPIEAVAGTFDVVVANIGGACCRRWPVRSAARVGARRARSCWPGSWTRRSTRWRRPTPAASRSAGGSPEGWTVAGPPWLDRRPVSRRRGCHGTTSATSSSRMARYTWGKRSPGRLSSQRRASPSASRAARGATSSSTPAKCRSMVSSSCSAVLQCTNPSAARLGGATDAGGLGRGPLLRGGQVEDRSSARSAGAGQLEHRAAGQEHVELAVVVLPERLDLLDGEVPRAVVDDGAAVDLQAADARRRSSRRRGRCPARPGIVLAAVHVAAGDRAARRRGCTRRSGSTRARRVLAALEGVGALHLVPAQVGALAGVEAGDGREPVDLLEGVLADVGDPEVAGGAVEGEPPRVAHAVEPDLGRALVAVGERVARRDAVGGPSSRAALRVDAQDLAEERRSVSWPLPSGRRRRRRRRGRRRGARPVRTPAGRRCGWRRAARRRAAPAASPRRSACRRRARTRRRPCAPSGWRV